MKGKDRIKYKLFLTIDMHLWVMDLLAIFHWIKIINIH